ncbi:hypothetical protein GCM10023091_30820 [Ravibacter arvi]|uniref:Outer membrane protein beta-barrel domain-containing protein n=1 Tax=Ravibacter arvi TaxID=2051041 RepID=A0ABP8M214_9BACT
MLLFTLAARVGFGQEEYFKIEDKEKKTGVTRAEAAREIERPETGSGKFADKLRLGGSFGLRLGSYTNINLSPMAGVALTDNFVMGLGATYMYVRSSYYIPTSNDHFYGARAFARYNFLPMIHLHAEHEMMNVSFYNHGYGKYQFVDKEFPRRWIHSPMLGIGYTQPLEGKLVRGIHATLLYNFNYNNHINPSINYDPRFFNPSMSQRNISPYASPIVFRVTIL